MDRQGGGEKKNKCPNGWAQRVVIKYLMGRCREGRARLFAAVPSARKRGRGHKVEHGRCNVNIRKCFFIVRVTQHWHRFPKEAVESSSLQILRSHLGMILGT